MPQKYARILKIKINSTSRGGVLKIVDSKIARHEKPACRRGRAFIVTPNPEIIMTAQKDKLLAKILNSADLSLPDGQGLVLAARFLGYSAPKSVIRGREVFLDLCKLANKKGWKVFLLGGEDGVAEQTARKLKQDLKRIKIEFCDGPFLDKDANPVTQRDALIEKDVVNHINKFKPHLLFVGFGAPKQEKWAYKWLPKLDIGGAMVVGGTFDYFSSRAKLPPVWMANLGFEWLWRLISDPRRLKRIIVATVVFPLKVLGAKLGFCML